MRTLRVPLVAAAILAVLACGQPETAPLSQADRDAVRQADEELQEAVVRSDWDAVAEQYVEDAYLAPPDAGPVQGRREIRNYFVSTLASVSEFELEPRSVEGEGDLAYVRGRWSLSARVPDADGDTLTVADEGTYAVIRRRQDDGRWLIVEDLVHSTGAGGSEGPEDGGGS
ncbi:MAG: YybH family protein [Gemmatimonadota bacterium]